MNKKEIVIKESPVARIRRYFIAGLLVVLPLVLTIFIFWKLFAWMEGVVDKILGKYSIVYVPGLGVVILLLFITFIGMVTTNFMGRRFYLFSEKVLSRIPLFNKVYKAIQEISYASLGRGKGLFREVVLVEYPRQGLFTLGFLTNETQKEISENLKMKCVNIFIPTAPNPTSGMLIVVPEDKIIRLPLTIEEGFKLIVSGGAFNP